MRECVGLWAPDDRERYNVCDHVVPSRSPQRRLRCALYSVRLFKGKGNQRRKEKNAKGMARINVGRTQLDQSFRGGDTSRLSLGGVYKESRRSLKALEQGEHIHEDRVRERYHRFFDAMHGHYSASPVRP